MLDLLAFADIANRYRDELQRPVRPLLIGDRSLDTDEHPAIMGTVNLSRDSTYRESVAVSTQSAVRKARIMSAQGADVIDVGAESSTAAARRVAPAEQIAALVPVIEQLRAEDIATSVETYEPDVVRACLIAGATMLNMTGVEHQEAMLDLAATHGATVVLCYAAGDNVREITDVEVGVDPIPALLSHFEPRVELALDRGVDRIVIDPGMGFYYGNLTDPRTRARHQAQILVNGFRLRALGLPICNALPHAFDLFEDEFRSGEAFYAVLALLGRTGLFRTHEVPRVRAVLGAMAVLSEDA